MARIEKLIEKINVPVRQRLKELFSKRRHPFEVYGLLSEFMNVEGKLLRPALCLASCEAVGGRKEDAVSAAVAIEMFHNFTLIHDDIEDNSLLRRGKPCLHIKYGLPLALNAGDGLFMMVWKETLAIPGERREEAQRRLLGAFTKVLEGQAIELGWYLKKKWDVKEKDYRVVVEGKTGALISCACEVGGLLGGAEENVCKALGDFGLGIGVGFQIMDDVLNLIGDEKKYGKEIGGDILEGKRTLITIRALNSLGGEKKTRLERLLKKENKGQKDVEAVISLLEESGAIE
ncbi:MAG: polyprenyl synthetase family protein, partial [Candidatus Anstonellaceae archaeon]